MAEYGCVILLPMVLGEMKVTRQEGAVWNGGWWDCVCRGKGVVGRVWQKCTLANIFSIFQIGYQHPMRGVKQSQKVNRERSETKNYYNYIKKVDTQKHIDDTVVIDQLLFVCLFVVVVVIVLFLEVFLWTGKGREGTITARTRKLGYG